MISHWTEYASYGSQVDRLQLLGVQVKLGIPQPAPRDMTPEQLSAWKATLRPETRALWEENDWSIRKMVKGPMAGEFPPNISAEELELWIEKYEPSRLPTWAKMSIGVGLAGLGTFLLWKAVRG